MATENTIFLTTKLGDLSLVIERNKLLSLSICDKKIESDNYNDINNVTSEDKTKQNILQQLQQYFSNSTAFKALPLAPHGTKFQQSVWNELTKIPVGETRTYGQIASQLKSSARAVGNACRKNPIAIIIPCHRVVSAKGIGGYAGQREGKQIKIKRWLLNHEGVCL